MLNAIKRFFRSAPRGDVVYPFRPLLAAMDRKDRALRVEVGSLPPSQAAKRWREVYPEDFPFTRNGPAKPITWHPHEMTPSEISDWIRAGWVFPVRYHCRREKPDCHAQNT